MAPEFLHEKGTNAEQVAELPSIPPYCIFFLSSSVNALDTSWLDIRCPCMEPLRSTTRVMSVGSDLMVGLLISGVS